DFIDGGRAEILARIAVFMCASTYTDVEIEHLQMWRLIFVVFGARTVNIGDFIEGQLVVVFRRPSLRNVVGGFREAVEDVQLAQVLVTGLDAQVSEQSEASGRVLQTGLDQPPSSPVAERLMEIADFVKLIVDVALFDQLVKPLQLRLVEASGQERL